MLTGKDIHTAFTEHEQNARTWDAIAPKAQSAYDVVAIKLNVSHLIPLQGLVREFVTLLEDDELVIEDNSFDWWDRRRAALALAKQLCGEEKP
jgi:hypothetical protein